MAPFRETGNHWRDNYYTFLALKHGYYHVSVGRTLDHLARIQSKNTPPKVAYVTPGATLGEIREAAIDSQCRIMMMIEDVELEASSSERCANELAEMATYVAWRIVYGALVSGAFAATALASLLLRRKAIAVMAGLAALSAVYSLLDEFDIRAYELNRDFDTLCDLCKATADDLLELSLGRDNHNFFVDVLVKRFGTVFKDGPETEEELSETYDPDYYS